MGPALPSDALDVGPFVTNSPAAAGLFLGLGYSALGCGARCLERDAVSGRLRPLSYTHGGGRASLHIKPTAAKAAFVRAIGGTPEGMP